jgi:hypothetical protein
MTGADRLGDRGRGKVRSEILGLVVEENMTEYADLVNYCQDHRPEWLGEVIRHTRFWCGYLASARGDRRSGQVIPLP